MVKRPWVVWRAYYGDSWRLYWSSCFKAPERAVSKARSILANDLSVISPIEEVRVVHVDGSMFFRTWIDKKLMTREKRFDGKKKRH